MNVGQSFSPLNQPQGQGAQGNYRTTSPVQDAIKILSLRLPTLVGKQSPSGVLSGVPNAAGGGSDNALMQNWLRQLFAGFSGGSGDRSPVGGGGPAGDSSGSGGGMPSGGGMDGGMGGGPPMTFVSYGQREADPNNPPPPPPYYGN